MNQKIILVMVAVMAFAIGLWVSFGKQPAKSVLGMLPEAKEITDVMLEKTDGSDFLLQDLQGKWSVISIGYTSCPDICPDTLYKYKTIKKLLAKAHPKILETIQFVFVSVDPVRDSKEQLKKYLQYFDPDFVGVTGTTPALKEFGQAIFAQFETSETGEENYEVAHSASLHIVSPEGKLFGVVTAPFNAETAAQRLIDFYKYYEAS